VDDRRLIAMVHVCPRCELRFVNESEVASHLAVDHGLDQAQDWGRPRYRIEGKDLPPLYVDTQEPSEVRRVLVVANQTLGGPELTAALRAEIATGPLRLHVVVPATHSADYPTQVSAGGATAGTGRPGPEEGTDQRGLDRARWRLQHARSAFAGLGVPVTGEVGPADPYAAVGAVLERERFDEVVISTLPPTLSRWLETDLAARVRRRFGVKVTTVVTS
jgi:hypothetical protein